MESNSKLEAARRLRGWTLGVASQKIGVHPRTLRRWETGKSKPQGFRVFKISQIYETTPSALGIASSPPPHDAGTVSGKQNSPLTHISEPALSAEDLDLHLIGLILQRKLDRQNLDYQTFQRRVDQCIKDYDEYMRARQAYNPADSARQQALRVVASVPIVAYLENLTPVSLPAPPEDILTHCASAITVCWHMGQEEDLKLARSFVTGYMILLSEVFSRITSCRQAAAALIAQACLLRTILAYKLEGLHAGVNYYARALEFSLLADAAQSSASQSLDLTALYGYGKQPAQVLRQMAESIWLLRPAPAPPDFRLIRDYLQKISVLYKFSALQGYEHDESETAEFRHFPPTLDYAEAALNLWDGMIYHELDEYAQTLDSLRPGTTEEPVCDAPEQVRVEFLPNRALASLRLHDMNQAITTLRASIPQVLSLGGEQELLEARKAYHLMQFTLPGDSLSSSAELKDLLRIHD
jgi:transcriptional regulator with XRE-family HTH domain